MMYDTSLGGRKLRTYTSLSLAWWHSYKWATTRIVQVFSNDFIGPMFHFLHPRRVYCPDKMKLPATSTYLSYIRLAYPSFRQQLSRALQNDVLLPPQKTLLKNLQAMCEFFIPVVNI